MKYLTSLRNLGAVVALAAFTHTAAFAVAIPVQICPASQAPAAVPEPSAWVSLVIGAAGVSLMVLCAKMKTAQQKN